MKWAIFLHFYQPAEQQQGILDMVVNQSYRPILQNLKKFKKAKVTLNISGSLLELFDKYKYYDLIDLLKELGESKTIEFTSSAKYHAFLPLIPKNEIIRQIISNNETNRYFLGDIYKPKGFFPPEMGYSENLASILKDLDMEWILLDEIALYNSDVILDDTKIYEINNSNLKVYFRNRRISNLIMSAVVRSEDSLAEAMRDEMKRNGYLITGMDGETFGHHRPGLENLLFQIFNSQRFELITISDISKIYGDKGAAREDVIKISPIKSTWASSKQDIDEDKQFLSWNDKNNHIHKLQWKFVNLVLSEINKLPTSFPDYEKLRKMMDMALASDHFWWASAKPWWSLEMIELGAFTLLRIISSIKDISPKDISSDKVEAANNYYKEIVSTAFGWQRSGKIRKMTQEQNAILRIPFKERTLEKGGAEEGVYHAFIDMMRRLELEAAKMGEYEKAVLWRDAIYKLENKQDIYDAINAVDLLRAYVPHEEVEKTIERYKEEYRKIRGGQPEQRGS